MHHISEIIEGKVEPTIENILGQYVKLSDLLYDTEIIHFFTMVKTTIAHKWKRESSPSIKQWYTQLWSFYVMTKFADSLKTIQKETDNSYFTAVQYPVLT